MGQIEETLKERELWFVKGEDGAAGKYLESHKVTSSMFPLGIVVLALRQPKDQTTDCELSFV